MTMKAMINHEFHEYERSKSNKEIYRCIHPECTHYHRREFLIGKKAICPKCKKPFILDKVQLRNKLPVCEFCSKSPKAKALNIIRQELEELESLENFKIEAEINPEELEKFLRDSTE